MKDYKPHISEYNKKEVNRIKKLLEKYKVIAIADMTNMPSPQLQKLRISTKDSVLITMAKARLIKIVFKDLSGKIKGLEKLNECIRGMPALLMTNESPFKLAKKLKKSKSSAPAKAGQLAPNDINVPAGPTPFPPGPIMGELGQIGIKVSVVDGKINIKEDTLVVKEGQPITGQVANLLTRLGIEPMEIGINLMAALENGVIFAKEILNIDEITYINNLKLAARNSFNLAFNTAYPTKENIKLLIKKAFMESNSLADSKNILTSENVKKEIAKANSNVESLKNKLNLPEEFFKKKESEEVKKAEENKKESKPKVNEENHKKEEEVAQGILKKLQDEKLAKSGDLPAKDKNFEIEEKMAKDVLKKAQDEKMKKA